MAKSYHVNNVTSMRNINFEVINMLGTIFQLSAALLFAYQIAFRNKQAVIAGATFYVTVISEGKRVATEPIKNGFLARNTYLVGVIYLIIGYLLPLTNYNFPLEYLNSVEKIILALLGSTVLFIIGDNVGKILTSRDIRNF